MLGLGCSLVEQFDDIVACSGVLNAGIEGDFARFVGHQAALHAMLCSECDEKKRMKSDKEAVEIKLKHARNTIDFQIKRRNEAEDIVKQYEKQFTIIKELLNTENRMGILNDEEKKSLMFLKENNRRSSQGTANYLSDSTSTFLSPSDVSVDPLDMDEDVSILRSGTRWKRRRTQSSEKVMDAPPQSRKRTSDSEEDREKGEMPSKKKLKSSLSPEVKLNPIPPLEKAFSRPPPNKNRRKPSKGHLVTLATGGNGKRDLVTDVGDEPCYLSPQGCSSPTQPTAPPLYPALPTPSPSCPLEGNKENAEEQRTPSLPKAQSDINMTRRHTFFTKTIIKLETCHVCKKKIKFGKNCLKCRDCRSVCHPECKSKVPLPCIPSVPTPKKKSQDVDLAQYCPHTIPRVPALVVHCVKEIEKRGLTDVGIYRVPGSDKKVKEVKEVILRAKGNPDLASVADVNVLCGVLKDFLRKLRQPLLTFRMHKVFIDAAELESDEDCLASTLEAIADLPPANKDTLAFLILHLQKVAAYSESNKMPMASLAKVFGPTIVGHSCPDPAPSEMWRDTQSQPRVVQRLMSISSDYWRQYLSPMENPDPMSPTLASPGAMSPASPEVRPVPASPFLGSLNSPRSRPLRTPSSGTAHKTKRPRTFFAAPN